MIFIKKYLKFIIGIAVVILAVGLFFATQQHTEKLENSTLNKWIAASNDRRIAAVQILSASDENTDLIVKCVNKIALLNDAGDFAISDAVRMCNMGMQLKEFN